MVKCITCGWKYPRTILNQLFIKSSRNSGYTGLLCGICALEQINQTHGSNDKKFEGHMAESMRLSAIEWRERHPDHAPNYPVTQ